MTTKQKTVAKTSPRTAAPKGSSRTTAKKTTNAADSTQANDAPHTPHTPHTQTVPARRAKKAPKLSAMRAAVQVLADAPEEGMRTKDMVEAMGKQGLWTSPSGKTPEATLYAGITREIAKKGDAARFRKVSKGRFVLR